MKKVFGIFIALVLMPVTQAQAWIGGPFSNNSFFPNGDDGIYEAFATVPNGLGMFRFAVRNNGNSGETGVNTVDSSNVQFNGGLLGSASSHVWYYRGITYIGPCVGTANSSFGIVSAIGNATTGLSGQENPLTTENANPAVANPASSQVGTVNNIQFASPGAVPSGNVGFANSSWTAKIKDKFPIVRFSGSGSVTFLGNVNTFSTVVINPLAPATESAESSSGGESSKFEQKGHRRRFLVFGSRVSLQVSQAVAAAAAGN